MPPGARPAKEAAVERLRTLKKRLTVATILGFGVFSWLAVSHGTGHATGPAAPPAASGGAAQVGPSVSRSQAGQSQGGFFDQGGGGYGFGNAQGGPVAGSGAS
jgi:hypothetical protein